jgi:esterase/lipase
MKERETVENKKVDQEIIKNIENKFDKITNPDLWLQHGFDSPNHINKANFIYLPNDNNHNNNSIYIYEQQQQQQQQEQKQPVKQLYFNRISKKVSLYSFCSLSQESLIRFKN